MSAGSIPLAADAALPMRDVLLDAGAMPGILARVVAADGPVTIGGYERGRVKYRVGESLRVLHRFTVDGVPALVASRMFAEGSAPPPVPQLPRVGALRAAAFDEGLATAFWTFPHDRKLATLAALVRGDAVNALIGTAVTAEIVQYAPEKSATVACSAGGAAPVAFVKAYADPSEGERSHLIHARLSELVAHGHPDLGLPRLLGYDGERRLLAIETVRGARLDAVPHQELDRWMERLGAAAAALHALPPIDGLDRFTRLDPDKLVTAAAIIGAVRPDVADAVAVLAGSLGASAPASVGTCMLHGDVHPKNAFAVADRVVLIDLDQLGLGAPAQEIGSALAAMRALAVTGRMARADAAGLEARFLAGYARTGTLPPRAEIDWNLAAALLAERALRAVNRLRPDGLGALPELLAEAGRVLSETGV